MKSLKIVLLVTFAFACCAILTSKASVQGQASAPTEAPAAFDNQTNGFTTQAEFDENKEEFDGVEEIADGIGPVYNAQSCRECHQNPISGSSSQILEVRAGHFNGTAFVDHPGGSLIHSRAIEAGIQEQILDGNEVRAFRSSLSTLGDGFVECIADATLQQIARNQPIQSGGLITGRAILVPVLEADGALRVGRFGWKAQHASLLSFSADAYLNEMGITSPLQPNENTANGDSVAAYDTVADPEDDGIDVAKFANFMRATKVSPRGPINAEVTAGAGLFNTIGCATCHVPTIVTAPPGTLINGGKFTVPEALGNKTIHPYGDFLLHNIGTGDGIVQNGGPETRNEVRTVPLWGLRTRNRFMHDGQSLTLNDAILRHGGEATLVKTLYLFLPQSQRNQILAFLNSL